MDADSDPQHATPETNVEFRAVTVTDVGKQKIAYIKLLREVTGRQLAECKAIADRQTPYVLVACDVASAAEFQQIASGIGVTVELRDYDESVRPVISNDQTFNLAGATETKTGCASAALLILVTAGAATYGLVHLLV